MSFWDKIFGEFIDIVEWTDTTANTMVYRFERYGNEIKYGAMLTVRESQIAIFVNEGLIADLFEPGLYKLETNNLPILSTLQSWPHGFESPFKAEVYFFNKKRFTDLKWGTKNPIMLRDKEFGPVRLRAFGTYAMRIKDPVTFLKEVVGTNGNFTTEEITNQLRNLIVSRFASILGESRLPILDLAANYDELSDFITNRIQSEFQTYGLEITKLLVENISLPDAVEKALDRRSSMGVIGNLRDYATFQAAESMRTAADNPAGAAAEGIGLGVGMAMAKSMAESLKANETQAPQAPPPVPVEKSYYIVVSDHQTGPFSMKEMEIKINNRDLQPESLVWTQGIKEWQKAEELPELARRLANVPPPLPD